jgi:hypothetical protein
MNDEEAHAFYSDPENLTAVGPGQRRERPMKTAMTPIRFAPEMLAAAKRFASEEGMTVSAWIRGLVAREIQRRQPSATSSTTRPELSLVYSDNSRPQSETASSVVTVPEFCAVLSPSRDQPKTAPASILLMLGQFSRADRAAPALR